MIVKLITLVEILNSKIEWEVVHQLIAHSLNSTNHSSIRILANRHITSIDSIFMMSCLSTIRISFASEKL